MVSSSCSAFRMAPALVLTVRLELARRPLVGRRSIAVALLLCPARIEDMREEGQTPDEQLSRAKESRDAWRLTLLRYPW